MPDPSGSLVIHGGGALCPNDTIRSYRFVSWIFFPGRFNLARLEGKARVGKGRGSSKLGLVGVGPITSLYKYFPSCMQFLYPCRSLAHESVPILITTCFVQASIPFIQETFPCCIKK